MENNRENASAQTETEFEPISLVCDILKKLVGHPVWSAGRCNAFFMWQAA
mgnify:CR=1 FL=1